MRQLAALIWLRSRIWWHGLRSRATLADNAVAVILALVAAVLSAALSFALAGITHLGLMDRTLESVHSALMVVFWFLGFLAVVMPVFFAVGRAQVPLRRLLVFPLSKRRLYGISLAASLVSGTNLFWYPSLASVTAVAIFFDRVPAGHWLAVVALFSVGMVVWSSTLLAAAQWMLRTRNVRELMVLVGLVLVVVAAMLPAMIQEQAEERGKEWFGELVPESWVLTVSRAATAFPPSIAVDGLETSVLGRRGAATTPLLWLFLWAAGGVAIGYGIVRRSLLGGEQAGRVSSTAVLRREGTIPLFSAERLTVFPAEVQAVAAKEMRYLLRSTSGKFNLVIMPIFVVVMALVVARDLDHSFLGLDRASLIFVGLMIYSSMFSNNFLFNAYAWERAGVQSYFLSPVLPERVVLGKNLGVWLYNLILGTEAVVVFSFMAGIPRAEVLIGGCLAFVASIGSATFVGNLLSPALPVPRDMASISNSPSQTAVLATFGVLVLNALLIGSSVSIPAILGAAWFGPILLALLIVAEIVAYGLMLPRFGHLLDSRREAIIEALRV